MQIDGPLFAVGLVGFVLVSVWLLSDWRVRSLRAVGLLLAALLATSISAVVLDRPLSLGGILLAGILVYPVVARHPALMPLAAPDAAMVNHVERLERELVRAGNRLRRNPTSVEEYARNLQAIHRRLRQVRAPDDEWGALFAHLQAEVAKTASLAAGRASHPDFRRERAANRARLHELVGKRRTFWR